MDAVSGDFLAVFDSPTMSLSHKLIAELGNNRFNDGQKCTASSVKTAKRGVNLVTQTDVTNFWSADGAFNNQDYNYMKWAVVGSGITLNAKETGTGPRIIDLDEKKDYEYGWWSSVKSDGSGTFATPQWVKSEFRLSEDAAEEDPPHLLRRVNVIDLHLMEGYPTMDTVSVEYLDEDNDWITVIDEVQLLGDQYKISHQFDLEGIMIGGLRATIHKTLEPNDYARVSELNGRFIVDLSEHVMSMDINEVKEEYEGSVPVGVTSANTFEANLENTEQLFSQMNAASPYQMYIQAGTKVMPYLGVHLGGGDYEYNQMGEYWVDEWSDGTEAEVSISCRDYSKFLQDDNHEMSRAWKNKTVEVIFNDILTLSGYDCRRVSGDMVHVDEGNASYVGTRVYPTTFIHEKSPWGFMGELALADMFMFNFDHTGGFKTYQMPALDGEASVYDLSDLTNIITGSTKTQIYANEVKVEVSDYSVENHGIKKLWGPEDPTILSYARLKDSINSTATTIYVEREERQENGLTEDNSWPEFDGILFFPQFDSGGHCTGGELVKYKERGERQFNNCTRGYLGTRASSHSANSYIGEAREWDMEFSGAPALTVKWPYATAIDAIYSELGEGVLQAYIPIFRSDQFRGKIVVANIAKYLTWLEGTGQTLRDIDDKKHDVERKFSLSVAGEVATDGGSRQKVTAKLEDIKEINVDHQRRYGLNKLNISSDWIQSRSHAQDLANSYISEYARSRSILELDAVVPPSLNLNDRVTVVQLDSMAISDVEYNVIGISHSYDGSIQARVTLRECKV